MRNPNQLTFGHVFETTEERKKKKKEKMSIGLVDPATIVLVDSTPLRVALSAAWITAAVGLLYGNVSTIDRLWSLLVNHLFCCNLFIFVRMIKMK